MWPLARVLYARNTLRCDACNVLVNVPLRRVRQRVNILREERRALLAKGNRTVPIQAIFRGFMTRRDDKLLGVRIQALIRVVADFIRVRIGP